MKHTGLQPSSPKGKLSQKAAIYPEETLAMILATVIWCDKNPIVWGQLAGKKPFSRVTKLIFTGFVANKGRNLHARSQDPS